MKHNDGKCPKCGGTGKAQNDAVIGAAMKARRNTKGMTLKELGKRLGLSASYLCDMEHGRRSWSSDMRDDYIKRLEEW